MHAFKDYILRRPRTAFGLGVILSLLLGAQSAPSGCAGVSPAVTAAICADAGILQASTVTLNANQTLALNGVVSTCASTSGGTVFTNASLAVALINDAILLQSSGLLSDIHITAQVPEDQKVLRQIKIRWQNLKNLGA